MTEQKATNVHWHEGEIQREHRHQLLGQQGATLWFTGLSGSGKSTVAVALEEALFKKGKLAYRLDGDNIRLGINKNLGFSAEDRTENIRRIGEVAKLFVECELAEAEKRDPKGLYKKARAGQIKNFTGIDDPYEAPEAAEIHLHTDRMTLAQEVDMLLHELTKRGILSA